MDAGELPAAARVAPAWRPGLPFVVAYADTRSRISAYETRGALRWRSAPIPGVRRLEWSSDGVLLFALAREKLVVLRRGRPVAVRFGRFATATFRPGTHGVTLIRSRGGSSEVVLGRRVLFRGTGESRDLAWSPNGRWLLVTWPTADRRCSSGSPAGGASPPSPTWRGSSAEVPSQSRRMVLLALAALLALVPAASAARTGGTPVAFVSAERADQLVAVDLPTGNVIARIRVPPGPHNVAATGDRWVMVTSPPAGAVTLVDARSLRVVKIFRGFGYPHDVEIDGGRAYVTDEARGQLVVISIAGRRVIARVPVGPRPHDVAVGDLAIVTHGPSQPDLTLVEVSDLDRLRAVRRMAVGGPAHDISKQPDTANIYLTYWGSGVVGAVDGGRGRVLWRRQIGSLVHHVQFDYFHGRRLWVTDHETGRAYLLSSRDGRILRSLGGCPGAHHVAFTPRLAAFACHDSSSLLVYDTATARTRPIRVGAGPHGLAVAVRP